MEIMQKVKSMKNDELIKEIEQVKKMIGLLDDSKIKVFLRDYLFLLEIEIEGGI